MIVHLLRHGKTPANERHLYCGSTDVPLSDAGNAELAEMAVMHKYPPADGLRICTSGLLRTVQTLQMLYGICDYEEIPGLRELDFGSFEMHSYDELKNDAAYIAWITDETGALPCPGGESSEGFKERVFDAFDSVLADGQDALIVCHGGVIAQLMARMFPYEERNFYEWQPSAGRGYTVTFENGIPAAYTAIPV